MQLNFPKNTSGKGGESALRQKQSENNLYLEEKKSVKRMVSGRFSCVIGGFSWFRLVSGLFQVATTLLKKQTPA